MSADLPPIFDTDPEDKHKARPIVFCHGMFCPAKMWNQTIADLPPEKFRSIWFNFYGHGDGLPTFPGMNMYNLADLIEKVMDAKKLERAIVVGFSMGGMAAMRLALRAPERFDALALLNTTANKAGLKEWFEMNLTAITSRISGQNEQAGLNSEQAIFSPAFRESNPQVMADWLKDFMAVDNVDASRIYALIGNRDDVLAQFPTLKMPMLILGATRDLSTPPEFSLKMADQVLQSIVTFLPQSGHGTPYERPEQVSQYLQGFLKYVVDGGDQQFVTNHGS
jgi:pimeloyl-ACP methyl ester carboxylesterase